MLVVCRGLGSNALCESPRPHLADGDGGGAFGRRFPCWGRHLGAPPTIALDSLGESPVQFWTCDGGATGVVTSLEASLLETRLSFWEFW